MQKKEIETLSSKIVYRNRWMQVREDSIQRADGSLGIYGVVEKKDFAVIVPIQDNFIYLVEQYRYPIGQRFWELPQGSWEEIDIEPIELAKLELKQETGLVAYSMQHIIHLYEAYGYSTQGYDIFLAKDLEQQACELEKEEQGLISQKFKIKTVEEMILHNEIKDSVTVAAFGMLKLMGLIT